VVIASYCKHAGYFQCDNGRCIVEEFVCDGHKDCGITDDSDERNCTCECPFTCLYVCLSVCRSTFVYLCCLPLCLNDLLFYYGSKVRYFCTSVCTSVSLSLCSFFFSPPFYYPFLFCYYPTFSLASSPVTVKKVAKRMSVHCYNNGCNTTPIKV